MNLSFRAIVIFGVSESGEVDFFDHVGLFLDRNGIGDLTRVATAPEKGERLLDISKLLGLRLAGSLLWWCWFHQSGDELIDFLELGSGLELAILNEGFLQGTGKRFGNNRYVQEFLVLSVDTPYWGSILQELELAVDFVVIGVVVVVRHRVGRFVVLSGRFGEFVR